MKFLRYIFASALLFSNISCGNDDDICVSGEATPRLKMKFKTLATGKIKTVDTLYVDVDYGDGAKSVIYKKVNADSVLLPIRVDENAYTDIFVRTRLKGSQSKIRVSYNTKSLYVSPACGIKKLYENVSSELLIKNPVLQVEQNQTQIVNEDKTTLYLNF